MRGGSRTTIALISITSKKNIYFVVKFYNINKLLKFIND